MSDIFQADDCVSKKTRRGDRVYLGLRSHPPTQAVKKGTFVTKLHFELETQG